MMAVWPLLPREDGIDFGGCFLRGEENMRHADVPLHQQRQRDIARGETEQRSRFPFQQQPPQIALRQAVEASLGQRRQRRRHRRNLRCLWRIVARASFVAGVSRDCESFIADDNARVYAIDDQTQSAERLLQGAAAIFARHRSNIPGNFIAAGLACTGSIAQLQSALKRPQAPG